MKHRPATMAPRVLATGDPMRVGHGRILPGPAKCPWHDRPRGLFALFRRRRR